MRKTVKHSNEHNICGPVWKFEKVKKSFLLNNLIHPSSCLCSILDFSKRVYQGVRVKHTVKDLLAEKRSQQTNGTRYSVSAVLLLSPLPCFICLAKTNKVATVNILLLSQLRGCLFSRRRRKITSPCLHLSSAMLTNDSFWLLFALHTQSPILIPLQKSRILSMAVLPGPSHSGVGRQYKLGWG